MIMFTITSESLNSIMDIMPGFTHVKWAISGGLNNDILAKFKDMIALDCSECQLGKINGIDCRNLEELNLSNNNIKTLHKCLSGTGKLRKLNLSSNNLSNLEGLPSMVYLRELDISHNQISDLNMLYATPGLSKLNSSHNKIVNCDFISPLNIEYFNISHNQITDVTRLGLYRLFSLECQGNPIKTINANMITFKRMTVPFGCVVNNNDDGGAIQYL